MAARNSSKLLEIAVVLVRLDYVEGNDMPNRYADAPANVIGIAPRNRTVNTHSVAVGGRSS